MGSNQKNLGTIKSSNLCTEIMEYTAPDEVAVCNLASIALPKFVTAEKTIDHQYLMEVSKAVTRNLNRVIDINYYPVPEARNSNMRHRPIGIGVQGLADVFIKMGIPFESQEAQTVNREIFETIYFGAVTSSNEIAKEDGNYECFEPYPSNIFPRRVLSGEFPVVNGHLLRDLVERKIWNDTVKNKIIQNGGSVQGVDEIPKDLQAIYKTVWEISMKTLINMAADRGAYIDQSQSFNVFMGQPNAAKLTSMHFYGWKKGLKTGQYYLRGRAAAQAVKFTVDPASAVGNAAPVSQVPPEPEECLNCGS